MSKIVKKSEVINRCIKNCTTWYWATNGAINVERFNNACSSYAGNVTPEATIAIIDETIFGSGKKGMLFTEDGLYYSTSRGGQYFSYLEPQWFENRVGYNCVALNEMIQELYNIEIAPSGLEVLGGIIEGAANFLTELSELGSEETKDNDTTKMIENNSDEQIETVCSNVEEDDESEMLEVLQFIKSFLKDTTSMLQEYIDIKVQSEQEKFDYLYNIIMIASFYSGDQELIENDMFLEETKKEIYKECVSVKENIELVDNMLNNAMEGNALEKISLIKVTKLFVHRIKTTMEDYIEDEDSDEMYESSQTALKDMKNSIRKMTKYVNIFIEQLYLE